MGEEGGGAMLCFELVAKPNTLQKFMVGPPMVAVVLDKPPSRQPGLELPESGSVF